MDPQKVRGANIRTSIFFENSFNSIGRWDNFQKMFRCELSGEATTGGGAPTFALSLLFYVCSKIRSQFYKTLRQFSKQVSAKLGVPCPSWTQYKIDGATWQEKRRANDENVTKPTTIQTKKERKKERKKNVRKNETEQGNDHSIYTLAR